MKLLVFCLSATYLAFRGSMYQQTYGTAMGSPVSVTIANLVIEDVEERAIATTGIPFRFRKWYVNDTCTALLAGKLQELSQVTVPLGTSRACLGQPPPSGWCNAKVLDHHHDIHQRLVLYRVSPHQVPIYPTEQRQWLYAPDIQLIILT